MVNIYLQLEHAEYSNKFVTKFKTKYVICYVAQSTPFFKKTLN